MKKLNFAIVGAKTIAQKHLAGIKQTDEAEIMAVCDIHEEIAKSTAEKWNVPYFYTDYDEMLRRKDIDVVIVATPDGVHREGTVKALKAGKHVLCEKPMALTTSDCKAMIQASGETDKKLMIGQVCRQSPGFTMAKKMVDEGEIGELFFVESEYAHDYTDNFGQDGWRVDPRNPRPAVIGGGCHAVDLLRWIAGNPTEAFAYSNRKVLTDWPVDDSCIAVLKFPGSVNGKIFTSIGCKREYTMRTVLYGTKGTIIADYRSPRVTVYKSEFGGENSFMGKPQRTIEMSLTVPTEGGNVAAEIKEMCDVILHGKPLLTDGAEGARTVAVCEAIVISAKTGEKAVISYNGI